MTISKREKTLLVVLGIIIIILLYYMYVFKPFLGEVATLNQDISDKKTQHEQIVLQKAQLDALDTEISTLEQTLTQECESTPMGIDHPSILVFLKQTFLEKAEKVFYSFGQPNDYGYLESMTVSINIIASYENTKSILEALEESNYNSRVLKLTITPGATEMSTESDDEEPVVTPNNPDALSIYMEIEFFNTKGDIPNSKQYDFLDNDGSNTALF